MNLLFASLTFALLLPKDTPGESPSARKLHDILADEAAFDPELTDRAAALLSLRTEDAEDAVWWHSGYMKVDGEWKSYDEATSETATNELDQEYKKRRSQADSAKDHVKLAKWCKARRMQHRFRIHMDEAMSLDPYAVHIKTPADLGLVAWRGDWLTPEVARLMQKEEAFREQSFKKWGRYCKRVVREVHGSRPDVKSAKRLLSAITTPDGVPAVDLLVGRNGPTGAQLAVDVLSRIQTARSARVLVKYAVFSNLESVRLAATKALTTRRPADVAPILLDLVATEITESQRAISVPRDFLFP